MSESACPSLFYRFSWCEDYKTATRRDSKENTTRKTATFSRAATLRERQRHFDEPLSLFDSGEPTLLDVSVDTLLKKINSQVSRAW